MAIWRKRLIALLIGFLIGMAIYEAKAESGEWWVNLHFGSYHAGSDYWREEIHYTVEPWRTGFHADVYQLHVKQYEYNEVNLGAGLGYEFHRNLEARAGFVDKNSFNHTTIYAGVNWHTAYSRPVYVGLFGGMGTGYKDTPTGGDSLLIGVFQPNMGFIAYKRARVEFGVIPEFISGETESTVWTLSAGFKF